MSFTNWFLSYGLAIRTDEPSNFREFPMRLHLLLASTAAVLMAGPATAQTQPTMPAQQTGPVEVEIDQGVLRPQMVNV